MNNVLTTDAIRLSGSATSKEDAIAEVGAILVSAGAVTPEYVDAMFARESSVSTYMGNLLAIPHGTNEAKDEILRSHVAVVRYDNEIDWGGFPVRFVIGIAGKGDSHLEVLSAIATVFSDMSSVDKLLAATSTDEVFDILGLSAV
ncbi:MAG: PTS sugar transporter subunit IIA [Microbacteriaceae bacterium]